MPTYGYVSDRLRPDRKGAGILILAIVWALVGLAITAGLTATNPNLPHTRIPLEIRAVLWYGASALGLLAVWGKPLRGWALAALVLPVTVRIVSYLWAYAAALIPGPPAGYADGWYAISLHGAMLALVVYVAYEPDDRREPEMPQ